MVKSKLSLEDYDKLIDLFAQKLWLLRERWIAIKTLRTTNSESFQVWQTFPHFFDSVYRSFVYDFYVGICKLAIDKTKNVESMIKLLEKRPADKPELNNDERKKQMVHNEEHLVNLIKNNATLKKIKNQRDELLAHQSSRHIFEEAYSAQFRKENDPSPDEIENLLDELGSILQKMALRGSFTPLTLPNTPIGSQILKVVSILEKECMQSIESI